MSVSRWCARDLLTRAQVHPSGDYHGRERNHRHGGAVMRFATPDPSVQGSFQSYPYPALVRYSLTLDTAQVPPQEIADRVVSDAGFDLGPAAELAWGVEDRERPRPSWANVRNRLETTEPTNDGHQVLQRGAACRVVVTLPEPLLVGPNPRQEALGSAEYLVQSWGSRSRGRVAASVVLARRRSSLLPRGQQQSVFADVVTVASRSALAETLR